jgi:hypothetical protein
VTDLALCGEHPHVDRADVERALERPPGALIAVHADG